MKSQGIWIWILSGNPVFLKEFFQKVNFEKNQHEHELKICTTFIQQLSNHLLIAISVSPEWMVA